MNLLFLALKSLRRNRVRAGLTAVAVFALAVLFSMIVTVVLFLDRVMETQSRDVKQVLTDRFRIPSRFDRSYVDRIAQRFEGFYFGRFDVRYADVEAFRAGRDLAIVELNGVTSESTNLYDPANSLWSAYRTLIRQWEILFRIADANRRRGHAHAGVAELLAAACRV